MSSLLAATETARAIVIERSSTAWWIPFVTTLVVALVAAVVSYSVTWTFKKADIDRENAIRAADLVDEAEQIASLQDRYRNEGGAKTTMRVLQAARVRAQPLDNDDLDKRFQAALSHNFDLQVWEEPPESAQSWLAKAITNVREGLRPHLSAPKFFGRRESPKRWFPTLDELNAMPSDPGGRDAQPRIDGLVDWEAEQCQEEQGRAQ
jgi:hypothetical protein